MSNCHTLSVPGNTSVCYDAEAGIAEFHAEDKTKKFAFSELRKPRAVLHKMEITRLWLVSQSWRIF